MLVHLGSRLWWNRREANNFNFYFKKSLLPVFFILLFLFLI